MDDYEIIYEEIRGTIDQLSGLYDQAFRQYSHLVNEVLIGRITGECQIEHILGGLLDFGDDLRFLELSKKLCRHIFYQYPQLVGDYAHMYRALFEEKEDDNGTGNG